jgi:hypothetical protein
MQGVDLGPPVGDLFGGRAHEPGLTLLCSDVGTDRPEVDQPHDAGHDEHVDLPRCV